MILRFSTLFRYAGKRTQAALRQTEKQLRRALEDEQAVMANLGKGIYTVDAGGLVTYLNPAAEHLFGWSTVELLGRNMHDVTHQKQPDGQPFPAGASTRLQVLQKDADLPFYEDMFVRKDGTLFPVVYSCSALKSEGNIVGLAVVFRDVTAQKLTESDLRQAQAVLKAQPAELEKTVLERTAELRQNVDELEAFCYSLSHDMRAPLRAIRSFTGITLEENAGQLSPEGADRLQRVINSSEHMTRLLEDVLAFSRISRQPIIRVPVELEPLLWEIIQDRPELQPPKADVRLETPLLPVLGQATSLTQCLSESPGQRRQVRCPRCQTARAYSQRTPRRQSAVVD